MLRRQTIEKTECLKYIYPLLRTIASRHSIFPAKITNNTLTQLSDEIHVYFKEWQRDGRPTITSGSKLSFVYAEKLASKAYFKLIDKLDTIKSIAADNGVNHIYGTMLMINPRGMQFSDTARLNHWVVKNLRNDKRVIGFQKSIEDTFWKREINVHFHYLILSAQPLSKRDLARSCRKNGKRIIGRVTKSNAYKVENWWDAASYVVKQYGLPLPLKHHKFPNGSVDPLNQMQHFKRWPLKDQCRLLSEHINGSRGIQKHRFYLNRNNAVGAAMLDRINAYHAKKRSAKADRKYKIIHDIVFSHLDSQNSGKNCRLPLFDCSAGQLYQNARKVHSDHHYSWREHWIQALTHNVDLAFKPKDDSNQLSLF